MALYKDGNPVSGINSIPRLTLAQYNALNVKPEFWVRTDAPESYKKLSADQVSYDSNNTVKDKIDEVDKIRIISGNLPSNVTSTSVGQNIDLLSVNENLGTDYAVLAVNIYVFGQNRSLMNEFEQTAIISGNTSTIVGVALLKALTNSQYNNASVTIILGKLT